MRHSKEEKSVATMTSSEYQNYIASEAPVAERRRPGISTK